MQNIKVLPSASLKITTKTIEKFSPCVSYFKSCLGSVYMRRASSDTRAGALKRDDFQPGFI